MSSLMDKPHICRFDAAKDKAIARFVFAHGAGAGMDNDFMQQMASLLAEQNIEVLRFNFPYMQVMSESGKRRPPNGMKNILAHFAEVVLEQDTDLPLFIGGKSMGGRASTLLLADEQFAEVTTKIKGAMVLGYPFHPPGKPDKLRLDHLAALRTQVLIVQGARDTMGNADEVAQYDLPSKITLNLLEDGDHSLKPRKSSGFSHDDHLATACQHMVEFIKQSIG